MEQLLTTEQIMEVLKIKKSTLYSWVHQNKIPHIKLGRLLRFQESLIAEWIATKEHPQTAETSQKARIKRPQSKSPKANDDIQRLVNNAKKDILKK